MNLVRQRRDPSVSVRGLIAAVALVPGVVPLGVALGVAVGETAAHDLVAWSGGPLLVAGSAQLVLMSQLDGGSGVLAAAFAAVLVNARFVVYGAALARRFAAQPGWFRWLGPWFVVDQTYSIVATAEATGRLDARASADEFRRFYLAAALLLFAVWSASVGVGVVLGPVLPAWLPLEMVLSVMFVALVVPGLRVRSELAAAVIGVVAATTLSSTFALVTAAVAGAVVAGTPAGRERS